MKKRIVILGALLVAVAALYHSVYFEKLDARRNKELVKSFNPKEVAGFFWKNKLAEVLEKALDLKLFDSLLAVNPRDLVSQYGKSVGVTSNYSFLVKGIALTGRPEADKLATTLKTVSSTYSLQVKYIFGNAARDATGYFNVDDFQNTMDYNAVATELNSLVLNEVIAQKLDSLASGTMIGFVGAVEINAESIQKELDIIPLSIEIIR